MINKCPFCNLDKDRVIFENVHSYALLDIFPVTKGHTLIIPKRHILKLEDLNNEEILDIFETFKKVKIGGAIIDSDYLIVLTHFKGHVSAGFGGSIKNIGMGCAS
ncbi:DUF362 domain-containing protein, partial [bacterium]|nr:DUF362 domain-containing protein [bacterium]